MALCLSKMANDLPVSLALLSQAIQVIERSQYVDKTPLIRVNGRRFGVEADVDLYFKMEGMQTMGSFKIRGIVNQMENAPEEAKKGERTLITMSAGNYGRSFAYVCEEMKLKGCVLMPSSAPKNRVDRIQRYGLDVELMAPRDLQPTVDRYVAEKSMIFMHPFNDPYLIAGYGSIGKEIYEELSRVDIILVCCGGGGLLSGILSYAKITGNGSQTRIIGVEPEGASLMHLSLIEGRPMQKSDVKSIAGGLAPPFVGSNTFKIVEQFAEGIVLVNDDEIKESVQVLYDNGLVVESSGAAAFAALRCGKVDDIVGKRIVVILSGSNVSPEELVQICN